MDKPVLNVALIGEAWHGKSTLMGRLLHALGEVSDKLVNRMRSLASSLGKPGSHYAFLVNRRLEERRSGHTLDISTWRPVDLGPFRAKFVDLPGLLKHVKNAIPGVSQADAVLAVLDASSRPELGALAGLREHLAFCSAFGVRQAVVVVNKMDLAGYGRGAFERAVRAFGGLLADLGLELKASYVPASALEGDNLVEPSDRMSWYDGPTVLEALRSLEVPERPDKGPLRLPVHRYYDAARAATGVLRSGTIRVGSEVLVLPSGARGSVESIRSWDQELEEAGPGEDVGVRLRGVARYDLKKGSVICGPEDAPPIASTVEAEVKVLGPSELRVGSCPVLYCHEASAQVRIESMTSGEREVKALKPGSEGILVVRPMATGRKGLVIEPYGRAPSMAGLAFRMSAGPAGTLTVAVGKCLSVE